MDISDPGLLEDYAGAVTGIARKAGARILEIYHRGFDVHTKQDGSPVTTADQLAHELIIAELNRLSPSIPVLSEESPPVEFDDRHSWPHYWLIDPLDGTKEFISRRGEFTVNIALISARQPVLGVVYTPVQELVHWAWDGGGAFRQTGKERPRTIRVREYDGGVPTVVASRSHGTENLEKFLASVEKKHGGYELTNMGSALKICIVAEGNADIYPRLGPTSEWDTAAAHCVLVAAGGSLTDRGGAQLLYNKESILNPWFMASGGGSENWCRHLAGIDG
jgi:3'(2'), 5'-bisphosphate nucleotidase